MGTWARQHQKDEQGETVLDDEGNPVVDREKLNRYQYNGKELTEDLVLNWNDYGARWYDPAVGRFPGIDPIIEEFPNLTPYNYASNNPVSMIDLYGLQGVYSYVNESMAIANAQKKGAGKDELIQIAKEHNKSRTEDAGESVAVVVSLFIPGPEDVAIGIFAATKIGGPIVKGISKLGDQIFDAVAGLFKGGKKSPNDFSKQALSKDDIGSIKGGSSLLEKNSNSFDLLHSKSEITGAPGYNDIKNLSDKDLIDAVKNPANGNFVKVNTKTGKVTDGNTRLYEIKRRGLNVNVPYERYTPDDSHFWDFKF